MVHLYDINLYKTKHLHDAAVILSRERQGSRRTIDDSDVVSGFSQSANEF